MGEINQRPAPAVIKAKLAEIKRRYSRRHRHHRRTKAQMSTLRISELNRLFAARYGEQLPDNPEGRRMVTIAAHHLVHLVGSPQKRLMDWCSLRAPWMTVADIESILTEVVTHPRSWKADSLAWLLKLTYADRQALKIGTIGAIDCNRTQRAALRKAKDKLRKRTYRSAQKQAASAP